MFAICKRLNIKINADKSTLEPAQRTTYLGMEIDSVSFRASPSSKRMQLFLSIVEEFLSCERHPAQLWRVLLGHMASLLHLIPAARLRMRSVQWCLRRQWTFVDESEIVALNKEVRRDLNRCNQEDRPSTGRSLSLTSPDLFLSMDASYQGWGQHWDRSSSRVAGIWRRQHCLSMPGGFWQWRGGQQLFCLL